MFNIASANTPFKEFEGVLKNAVRQYWRIPVSDSVYNLDNICFLNLADVFLAERGQHICTDTLIAFLLGAQLWLKIAHKELIIAPVYRYDICIARFAL